MTIVESKKFERDERLRVKSIPIMDLLEQTIEMAAGDDYDGCFTPTGRILFNVYYDELKLRVQDLSQVQQAQ